MRDTDGSKSVDRNTERCASVDLGLVACLIDFCSRHPMHIFRTNLVVVGYSSERCVYNRCGGQVGSGQGGLSREKG
jgi:hypothetical protein